MITKNIKFLMRPDTRLVPKGFSSFLAIGQVVDIISNEIYFILYSEPNLQHVVYGKIPRPVFGSYFLIDISNDPEEKWAERTVKRFRISTPLNSSHPEASSGIYKTYPRDFNMYPIFQKVEKN